jgi:hypothetical protein
MMLHSEPHLKNERTEREDPRVIASRILKFPATTAAKELFWAPDSCLRSLKIERAEPNWIELRKESVDPKFKKSSTDNWEPNRPKTRSEKAEPKVVELKTDNLEPNLSIRRTLIEEPSFTKSTTEHRSPTRDMPMVDIPEPKQVKLRIEIDDPKLMKFNSDIVDPNRAAPYTLNPPAPALSEVPWRKNARRDNDDAKLVASRIEKDDPRRDIP